MFPSATSTIVSGDAFLYAVIPVWVWDMWNIAPESHSHSFLLPRRAFAILAAIGLTLELAMIFSFTRIALFAAPRSCSCVSGAQGSCTRHSASAQSAPHARRRSTCPYFHHTCWQRHLQVILYFLRAPAFSSAATFLSAFKAVTLELVVGSPILLLATIRRAWWCLSIPTGPLSSLLRENSVILIPYNYIQSQPSQYM